MVFIDDTHWIKFAFEATDLGSHAAVSVVTRDYSDDANGQDLDADSVWLQIGRQGWVFALHYSLDGQSWRMVRYFSFEAPARISVGMEAQSPLGEAATTEFSHFSIGAFDLKKLRDGI